MGRKVICTILLAVEIMSVTKNINQNDIYIYIYIYEFTFRNDSIKRNLVLLFKKNVIIIFCKQFDNQTNRQLIQTV
jgi:hypothetical protein